MMKVGTISEQVAELLGDDTLTGSAILLGESNIAHMKSKHLADYEKYGKEISHIVSTPDYIGKNPKDNSVEYVKEYLVDGEYVKVAVRISASGSFFARSLYILNRNRVKNFIQKGSLIRSS